MELEQLPLSPRLVADLREVSATYATVAGADLADDAMDDMERDMFRVSLEGRLRLLWQRARAELGRGYAVGLQTPGMIGPSWSLAEPDDCDGDIEF
jgi:hypothetical protein